MPSNEMIERARALRKRWWNGYSDLDTEIAAEFAAVQRETAEACAKIASNYEDFRGHRIAEDIRAKFLEGK